MSYPIQLLIAEDDEDDFLLIRESLESVGITAPLVWLRDGQELLDCLKRKGPYAFHPPLEGPALILLDLNMPRLDGRQALKELKADPRLRRIPVVVLTTSNADTDVHQAYELGVSAFMRKPVRLPEFIDTLKAFKQYWYGPVILPNGNHPPKE